MAEALVDHPKVIEVQIEQRHRAMAVRCPHQRFFETFREKRSVREPGQDVVKCHATELRGAPSDLERKRHPLRHQGEELTIVASESIRDAADQTKAARAIFTPPQWQRKPAAGPRQIAVDLFDRVCQQNALTREVDSRRQLTRHGAL